MVARRGSKKAHGLNVCAVIQGGACRLVSHLSALCGSGHGGRKNCRAPTHEHRHYMNDLQQEKAPDAVITSEAEVCAASRWGGAPPL
jgi:hypothetical protein